MGFIASVSRPFCLNCNRIRLTADGKLRYCLFAIEETDVKALLRSGAHATSEIADAIRPQRRRRSGSATRSTRHEVRCRRPGRCTRSADSGGIRITAVWVARGRRTLHQT